jgi:hypothetical protein
VSMILLGSTPQLDNGRIVVSGPISGHFPQLDDRMIAMLGLVEGLMAVKHRQPESFCVHQSRQFEVTVWWVR